MEIKINKIDFLTMVLESYNRKMTATKLGY